MTRAQAETPMSRSADLSSSLGHLRRYMARGRLRKSMFAVRAMTRFGKGAAVKVRRRALVRWSAVISTSCRLFCLFSCSCYGW